MIGRCQIDVDRRAGPRVRPRWCAVRRPGNEDAWSDAREQMVQEQSGREGAVDRDRRTARRALGSDAPNRPSEATPLLEAAATPSPPPRCRRQAAERNRVTTVRLESIPLLARSLGVR